MWPLHLNEEQLPSVKEMTSLGLPSAWGESSLVGLIKLHVLTLPVPLTCFFSACQIFIPIHKLAGDEDGKAGNGGPAPHS